MIPTTQGEAREDLATALDLEEPPEGGYRDREHLLAALDAGFEVAEIAEAHGVSRKTVYRALETHSISVQKPPSTGLAKELLDADPSAVGGGA